MGENESLAGIGKSAALSALGPSWDGRQDHRRSDHKAMQETLKAQEAMRFWNGEIAKVARDFESRWTSISLKRVDRELADKLRRQRNLYAEATIRGTQKQIINQGQGVCMGYLLATRRMEQAGEPDDAYMIGTCPLTGSMIAIGPQVAVERVKERYGAEVPLFTPDELASLAGRMKGFREVADIKRKFPGATIEG